MKTDQEYYEEEMLAKLKTVINAAKQNKGYYIDLRIQTTGNEPHASVTIPGHVLEKFIIADALTNEQKP